MVSLDKEKILAEVKKIKEGKEDRSKLRINRWRRTRRDFR